jgi:hypothetical protein
MVNSKAYYYFCFTKRVIKIPLASCIIDVFIFWNGGKCCLVNGQTKSCIVDVNMLWSWQPYVLSSCNTIWSIYLAPSWISFELWMSTSSNLTALILRAYYDFVLFASFWVGFCEVQLVSLHLRKLKCITYFLLGCCYNIIFCSIYPHLVFDT